VHADATDTGLESGRFTGAGSFNMLHHVPSSEAQDAIFRELCRVLRKGALLVAADAVYSEDLLSFHEGDTYNPIDPDGLGTRLGAAGFEQVDVDRFEFGWMCTARLHADALRRATAPGRSPGRNVAFERDA